MAASCAGGRVSPGRTAHQHAREVAQEADVRHEELPEEEKRPRVQRLGHGEEPEDGPTSSRTLVVVDNCARRGAGPWAARASAQHGRARVRLHRAPMRPKMRPLAPTAQRPVAPGRTWLRGGEGLRSKHARPRATHGNTQRIDWLLLRHPSIGYSEKAADKCRPQLQDITDCDVQEPAED
jgi:hypothetical protein